MMSPMPILLARARCGNLTLATVSRYSQLSINRRLLAALNEMSNVTPVCSGRWALAAKSTSGRPLETTLLPTGRESKYPQIDCRINTAASLKWDFLYFYGNRPVAEISRTPCLTLVSAAGDGEFTPQRIT